jgi:hypothetical protein
MTMFVWALTMVFGALFLFLLVALQLILVPGILLVFIVYDSARPRRGVAVTGSGVVAFRVNWLNADPNEALAMTSHGALLPGGARHVGGKVAIPFGSETVLVRARDFATLVAAIPSAPSASVSPAEGRPASPPPAMTHDLPRWRRASIGWVLLHFLPPCAAMLFVVAMSQLAAMGFHRDVNHTSSGGDEFFWLVFAMLLAGWYLFVYMAKSFRTRVIVLSVLWGGALVSACIVNTLASPAIH